MFLHADKKTLDIGWMVLCFTRIFSAAHYYPAETDSVGMI